MDCQSNCSCQNADETPSSSTEPSRRSLLGVMAATAIAVPLLAQSTRADDAPAGAWTKTVKPADVADKSAKVIKGPDAKALVLLVREGKTIQAISPKCTHKGCDVSPLPAKPTFHCKCHGAEFDFTGTNTRGPGKGDSPASLKSLSHFALRLNSDGIIEVDTSKPIDKDNKDATLTVQT